MGQLQWWDQGKPGKGFKQENSLGSSEVTSAEAGGGGGGVGLKGDAGRESSGHI